MSYNYYSENSGFPEQRGDIEAKNIGKNLKPSSFNIPNASPKGVNQKEINFPYPQTGARPGQDWYNDTAQDSHLYDRRDFNNNNSFISSGSLNPNMVQGNQYKNNMFLNQNSLGSFQTPGMYGGPPGFQNPMMNSGAAFDMSNPMIMFIMNFYETHLNNMKALVIQKTNENLSCEKRLCETNEKLQFLEEHLKNFSTKCETASDESMRKYLSCLEELNVYKQREKFHQEEKLEDLNRLDEERGKLASQLKALRDKNSFNEEKIAELESNLAEQMQKYNALNRINENLAKDLNYYKTSYQNLEKTHNEYLSTKNSFVGSRQNMNRSYENMKSSSTEITNQTFQGERPLSPRGGKPYGLKPGDMELSEDVQNQREKKVLKIPKEYNTIKEKNNLSTVKSLLSWEEDPNKNENIQIRKGWSKGGEGTPEKANKQFQENPTASTYEEEILNFFNQREMVQSNVYGAQGDISDNRSLVKSNHFAPQDEIFDRKNERSASRDSRRDDYKATGINILPSERRFESNREDIKRLEAELLQYNQDKNKIEGEIMKLPLSISTASHRRRKIELENTMEQLEQKISKIRNQLRVYDKNITNN